MKRCSGLSVGWAGLWVGWVGFLRWYDCKWPEQFCFSVGGSQAVEVKLTGKIHRSLMLLLAVLVKG